MRAPAGGTCLRPWQTQTKSAVSVPTLKDARDFERVACVGEEDWVILGTEGKVGSDAFRPDNALSHFGVKALPARILCPFFPNRPSSSRNQPESPHAGSVRGP